MLAPRRTSPSRRSAALLAAVALAAGMPTLAQVAAAQPAAPVRDGEAITDVAPLIDEASAGDIAAFEAALPHAATAAGMALLESQIAAARLDSGAAAAALARYFASGDADPRRQAIAWTTRANIAFADGDYATAAAAIARWQALPPAALRDDERAANARTLGVAQALAGIPAQARITGTGGAIATARDAAGLVRGAVAINGMPEDAVLDTGANLSVVSASAAARLKLRMLDATVRVGSSSADDVPARLAIADRIEIAGITLSNVVFLVFDDSKLSFPLPGGYRIDAIIGFPVFRALDRVRFDRAGRFAAGSAVAQAKESGGPIVSGGNDLYIAATVNGVAAPLHLDTGASQTILSPRFARRHADLLAGLPAGRRSIGGAGGAAILQPTVKWPGVTLAAGGRSLALPLLPVVTDFAGVRDDHQLGTLGQDVLDAFAFYAIDFRAMRFTLGAPR